MNENFIESDFNVFEVVSLARKTEMIARVN